MTGLINICSRKVLFASFAVMSSIPDKEHKLNCRLPFEINYRQDNRHCLRVDRRDDRVW